MKTKTVSVIESHVERDEQSFWAIVRDGNGVKRHVFGLTERPKPGDKMAVRW